MKIYKSKISYGLLVFIFFIMFLPMLFAQGKFVFNTLGVVINVVVFSFIIHLFHNTEYVIDKEILKIKCGFFYKKQIEINKIKKITKTNTLMSSPAASFDRIEIYYNKFESVVVSPKDKQAFTERLIELNPNIDNRIESV
ncbi:PH domain-containing protein [Mariniflexile jejuense]|uniref:PH domain-containing protein n=1 Tax=Mariniflexile jejuense TaxID=1173582 RepID=A0ABW3JHI8_9FLAO